MRCRCRDRQLERTRGSLDAPLLVCMLSAATVHSPQGDVAPPFGTTIANPSPSLLPQPQAGQANAPVQLDIALLPSAHRITFLPNSIQARRTPPSLALPPCLAPPSSRRPHGCTWAAHVGVEGARHVVCTPGQDAPRLVHNPFRWGLVWRPQAHKAVHALRATWPFRCRHVEPAPYLRGCAVRGDPRQEKDRRPGRQCVRGNAVRSARRAGERWWAACVRQLQRQGSGSCGRALDSTHLGPEIEHVHAPKPSASLGAMQ